MKDKRRIKKMELQVETIDKDEIEEDACGEVE